MNGKTVGWNLILGNVGEALIILLSCQDVSAQPTEVLQLEHPRCWRSSVLSETIETG